MLVGELWEWGESVAVLLLHSGGVSPKRGSPPVGVGGFAIEEVAGVGKLFERHDSVSAE